MRKSTLITLFSLLLVAALMLPVSSAQARFRGAGASAGGGTGPNFVDANNDGVCDWAQNPKAWEDATHGQYGSWVDANGDGICDNYADRPLDGTGLGYRGGH